MNDERYLEPETIGRMIVITKTDRKMDSIGIGVGNIGYIVGKQKIQFGLIITYLIDFNNYSKGLHDGNGLSDVKFHKKTCFFIDSRCFKFVEIEQLKNDNQKKDETKK